MSFAPDLGPDAIRGRRWRNAAYGVVLLAVGLLAVAAPVATSFAIEKTIGWLMPIGGAFGMATAWLARDEGWSTWIRLAASLGTAGAGVALLWFSGKGLDTLVGALTIFLAALGGIKTTVALGQRHFIPRLWAALLLSGLADLVMAGLVFAHWPLSAAWFLALLLGASLITSGANLLLIAISPTRLASALGRKVGAGDP